MADAVLADGRATGYTRELAAPSADWFLRMSHAGGGLGGGNDFTGNAVALYSSVGDYAGDQRTVLVDMDRVGELVHGEARNTGAPYTGAGGFARGHVALLVDQDRAGGLPLGGVADFLERDTAEHFAGLGALYSSNGGGVARAHGHGAPAPLLDKDRAGELPLGGVADFVERDMAAPHTVAGGVPFDKAQSVGTAAGAAPSSPNAAQVTIDVDFVAEAIEAKRAVGGRGSNLASAVVGIVTASSAVTMVAAGDVSPPVAFGLFVLMIAGLSLAVSGVRRV
uniref:Uncharacterized protein n=2 Tax=Oryza sativa subsp. japonica TaxID=39947 RepID=Q6Z1F2_ORYSJ|nr:hypothetical protein [Oryza sativa Japonica Group]BAD16171.1 hypothetical protein [Oryza sativa Japonica Group]